MAELTESPLLYMKLYVSGRYWKAANIQFAKERGYGILYESGKDLAVEGPCSE
jgi:hypothetical protein